MQLRWAAFGVLLAISLGVNAYLLADGCGGLPPSRTGAPSRPAAHRESLVHRAPNRTGTLTTELAIPADVEALDEAALASRLAADEKELEGLQPLRERFERAERSPEAEQRLAPLLDQALVKDDGTLASYKLECRGRFCRIFDVEMRDFLAPLQDAPELLGVFERMSLGSDAYVELAGAAEVASRQLFVRLVTGLILSADAHACKTPDAHHGNVLVRFSIDSATHQVHATISGPLATDVVGVCVRNAAERIAAATPVPPDVTSLPSAPYPYVVP
jgi:hypothetical protein